MLRSLNHIKGMARSYFTLAVIPVIAVIACLVGGCAGQSAADAEEEVMQLLTAFLQAFENGDLSFMEASFADDSVTFPRAIMSEEIIGPINSDEYMRVAGLDPNMRALIAGWQETDASGPPYMNLDPEDFQLKMFDDAALATFHLKGGSTLSRRTFVLARRDGAWKIVHLHASNVVGSE